MIDEYELYSDETKVNPHLIIGGISCTKTRRSKYLQTRLAKVRSDFDLRSEMRWGKVSSARYLDAYKAWVDVFLEDPHARFSMLVVDHSRPAAWRE
jgi:hypothetical protein